ncbi:Methionine aminopeptidase [[Clostridium] cellulosi]|jgi:methionine aminopeptidase, type I (EC 3.4.11.18)|uniref:Methionine aminopeptidase n=1 Tax=[Clostridium] cellulosi TaxID=29343 RepID=A0A078KII5_9FIRM|nr:MAG: type I methionyl aminopeptidase [[Clostridium] cellulosi]CDZ23346.1 Methionine aminopeptidase [[Clostridium] cellulosi]
MIVLKNSHQLARMKEAGAISADALQLAGSLIEPGITTAEIDNILREFILKQGAKPSFLNYNGYPASACISVNNVVIHGIPGKYKLKSGDIVSVDVGAFYEGFHGDNAATFPCGQVSEEAQRLIDTTRECLYKGIAAAQAGARLGDIGHAIQQYAEDRGYSVVRQYIGHGVGRNMHEEPDVPNYGRPGHGLRLIPGMTIAIEPMVNAGGPAVRTMPDGWTVKTCDGKLSAHFEHTIAITEDGPVILTTPSQEK